MFEAVTARPDGSSTVARLARTAEAYGYEGIVVRNHGDSQATYEPAKVREAYGVDVVDGVEIRADDPARASGFLGSHRPDRTIVVVHGGTPEMNRFAVEHPAVDVLARATDGDAEVDHVLAKTAAENGVRVEFSLASILRSTGGKRVRRIRALEKLRELVMHYDTPYVVTAGPTSHLEIRAPRDLCALGDVIGFDAATIREGLREWDALAERNRKRQSDNCIEPGVWRCEDESDRYE